MAMPRGNQLSRQWRLLHHLPLCSNGLSLVGRGHLRDAVPGGDAPFAHICPREETIRHGVE